MTTHTKRYRLLKDLPGVPAGTIYDETPEDGTYWAHGTSSELHVLTASTILDRAWFEPIPDTPERPYPWEPGPNDFFDAVAEGAVTPRHMTRPRSERLVATGNAWRTSTDAELRLRAEPLVNAAVKALLNTVDVPGDGATYWLLVRHCGQYVPVEGGWVGSGVPRAARHGYFFSRNDAQAVADLFNFFLTVG